MEKRSFLNDYYHYRALYEIELDKARNAKDEDYFAHLEQVIAISKILKDVIDIEVAEINSEIDETIKALNNSKN